MVVITYIDFLKLFYVIALIVNLQDKVFPLTKLSFPHQHQLMHQSFRPIAMHAIQTLHYKQKKTKTIK